ncbi:hypothetical protein [Cytobacillus sp. FSL R5-0596]|uniref:hypothetical protein n=1 Tax=Cytobacillus sp. FSL R5-0596 TaxID=2954696 RepID=UPI0030F65C77
MTLLITPLCISYLYLILAACHFLLCFGRRILNYSDFRRRIPAEWKISDAVFIGQYQHHFGDLKDHIKASAH